MRQKIFSYGLQLFPLILPVYPRFTGIVMAVFSLCWITQPGIFTLLAAAIRNRTVQLFTIGFLAYLIGMLHTENLMQGWQNILLKSSWLLFPFIFFFPGVLKLPSLSILLKLFLTGCLATGFLLFGNALYILLTTGQEIFFYSYLTRFLHLHPTYISMYFIFSLLVLGLPRLLTGQSLINMQRKWFLPSVIVLTAFVFLFSARQTLFALIALLLILLGMMYMRHEKRKIFYYLSAGLIALCLMLLIIPSTQIRIQSLNKQLMQPYSDDSPNSVTMRKAVWEVSWQLLLQQPFTGYGTGDVNDELMEAYHQRNYLAPAIDRLNAHNQYLQTCLAVGIPLFLVVMLIYFRAFQLAIEGKNELYAFFLLLFLLCSLTESMWETESGLLFFTFFNSALAALPYSTFHHSHG